MISDAAVEAMSRALCTADNLYAGPDDIVLSASEHIQTKNGRIVVSGVDQRPLWRDYERMAIAALEFVRDIENHKAQ